MCLFSSSAEDAIARELIEEDDRHGPPEAPISEACAETPFLEPGKQLQFFQVETFVFFIKDIHLTLPVSFHKL